MGSQVKLFLKRMIDKTRVISIVSQLRAPAKLKVTTQWSLAGLLILTVQAAGD